jgi:radical SAM/Cys-rich protein
MEATGAESFSTTLLRHGLSLKRDRTTTLQINVGFLCNLSCRHCHLTCGPEREEIMNAETANHIIDYAARNSFEVIDITGGSPELNPRLEDLMMRLASLTPRLMVRTNLTVLAGAERDRFLAVCQERKVVLVASFPSFNIEQTDAQRGGGTFPRMIEALKYVNHAGYGQAGSGLELNLVSNPVGAFMPAGQVQAEKRFREVLQKKWGIVFNRLYHFANVPTGRFREWLQETNNLEGYLHQLRTQFNPRAISSVMCRSLLSVDWQGYLYDCDFNLANWLYLGGKAVHVSELTGIPLTGSEIAVGDHCYACTAGAGFT